ncbi:adaptor protein MecA [Kurthia huakuii]|uniref:adaptor protein MecA n=1 Tax=Kurthia huakuii TaxID=1421019 RepID=UPI000496D46E|nr:adaptor protein MecA [Kurthia huakuii]MBM7698523.1 adapter protein MecA 1/2 [Kurthia huakuii]
MDIERINENTLKLFISYTDIEERGFTKDEIWYNRDKGEELFWVMMDEISEEDQFEIDGPLWIQVVAKEVGLELTVTTAKLTQEGLEDLPFGPGKLPPGLPGLFDLDQQNAKELDNFLEENFGDSTFEFVFELKDFDDLIHLAERLAHTDDVDNRLFEQDGKYYLYIHFDEEGEKDERLNFLSVVTECAKEAHTTIHVLEEYAHVIMATDALNTVRKYF